MLQSGLTNLFSTLFGSNEQLLSHHYCAKSKPDTQCNDLNIKYTPQSHVLNLWATIGGNVLEGLKPLGSGTSLKKVCYVEHALQFIDWSPLPICSLLPDLLSCKQAVIHVPVAKIKSHFPCLPSHYRIYPKPLREKKFIP